MATMALSKNSRLLAGRGRARVAVWASVGLYLVAVVMWALASWRSPRGTASAFATDLTGLALWGSLLVVLSLSRRFYPRTIAYLAQIVLGLVTLFSATQVVLDVTHRH